MEYDERLGVPLRWWAQGTMMIASVLLATIVALPPSAAIAVTAVAAGLLAAFFLSYGSARLRVGDHRFYAGRAVIDTSFLGDATPLDAEGTRRQAGVDADARAYLLLRPYLKRAVRVDLIDPDDPTPYWLVSTRHPEALARALDGVAGRLPSGPSSGEG